MTAFVHTTGFTRGEVEASLYDRFDVDFYQSASQFIDNWLPDVTGAIDRRPGFKALGTSAPLIISPRTADMPGTVDDTEFYMRTFLFRGKVYKLIFRQVRDAGWETVTLTCIEIDSDGGTTLRFEDEYLVYYSNASTDLATALGASLPPDSGDGDTPPEFSAQLPQNICLAQIGPAVFITSPLFPLYRVFVQDSGDVGIERVLFREEILGTVEVANGTKQWDGTDTLFEDQLSSGDTLYYKGDAYTVDVISDQKSLTTDETFNGISTAGERVQIDSDRFDTDWPRLCSFHKGRLLLFSTRNSPVGMWASKAGDPFTIISGSIYDDSPINTELLTEGAESFLWVADGDRVVLGGEQAEYLLDSLPDQPLTPTNFSFYRVSNNGGSSLQPFTTDSSTIFVNRGRNRVQAVRFNDTTRGYVGQDISLLSPHLLRARVRDIVFRPGTQNDRAPRIFVQLDNKEMRTCTIAESENIIAWSRITLATGYEVEAISESPEDAFALIRCPKDDTLVLTRLDVDSEDYYVMDLERTYTATNGVVALDDDHHDSTLAVLEGTQLIGFYDTTTELDIEDADYNGDLTVGVTFSSKLEMLPVIVPGLQDGASLNRKHRLVRVLVSVEEAYQMSINGEPIFGTLSLNNTTGLPLRNGTYERRFLGWGERPETEIEVTSLYRAKLRSVSREVQI